MSWMKVKKIDSNATIPNRAHSTDAGLDVFACENGVVHAGSDAVIRTGGGRQMAALRSPGVQGDESVRFHRHDDGGWRYRQRTGLVYGARPVAGASSNGI